MAAALLLATSCTDEFLKETKRDAASSDYLNTPEGLNSMAHGLTGVLQDYYARASWNYIQNGTDEMTAGSDTQGEVWNSYDARISPNSTAGMFDLYYQWIGRANTIIAKADVLEGSALKNETLGYAYFTRAFCYLFLVSQFGDVPLVTKPVTEPEREFSRQTREEVYNLIIPDLEAAYGMLTGDARQAVTNHFTKSLVMNISSHFKENCSTSISGIRVFNIKICRERKESGFIAFKCSFGDRKYIYHTIIINIANDGMNMSSSNLTFQMIAVVAINHITN